MAHTSLVPAFSSNNLNSNIYINKFSFVIPSLRNLIIEDRPRNGRAGAIICRKYFDLSSVVNAPKSRPISWWSTCSCQTPLRCIMKKSQAQHLKLFLASKTENASKRWRLISVVGGCSPLPPSKLSEMIANLYPDILWNAKHWTALFMRHHESWWLPKFKQILNLMQPRGTSQLNKLQNGVEILRRQYSII